ncbi:unnamed protein product [Absidia cylindrospora]
MHLGLLSNDRLSFDPLKPVILSGPSTEEGFVVFSGNVVLSLGKNTKVSNISVTLKSIQTTYWPEGIGIRGTRLYHERTLHEDTVIVLQGEGEKKGYLQLPAGIHWFMFVFVIPNSFVETVEDVYGRVKHSVEARVTSPGISLLNSWRISKPVLVLRTYLSNALLTNNSIQDTSLTFEKHLPGADIQLIVEQAVFSSGDLFHIRCVFQPHVKQVRLEHMELSVVEHRKYAVPEMQALRTDQERYELGFLSAGRLEENDNGNEASISTPDINNNWAPLFATNKSNHNNSHHGLDIYDTSAYRLSFTTPTCVRNFHHSTTNKDVLFRHHLSIQLSLSYPDPTLLPSPHSDDDDELLVATAAARLASTMINQHTEDHSGSSWLSKLRKQRHDRDAYSSYGRRKQELVKFEMPITVFDCRLKEDFGRLPSYFELPSQHNGTTHPTNAGFFEKGQRIPETTTSPIIQQDEPRTSLLRRGSCSIEAHVFLCPCYFAFRRQVERASEAQQSYSPTNPMDAASSSSLECVPSRPPPDYYVD